MNRPLDSLHHSPFTIYTMESYMLSNTHMIDKLLNKEDIEIDDIFFDVYKIQNVSHSYLSKINPNWEIDIRQNPLLDNQLNFPKLYSVDGTTLRHHPVNTLAPSSIAQSANYQLVTKIYISKWRDGLIWINLTQ